MTREQVVQDLETMSERGLPDLSTAYCLRLIMRALLILLKEQR